MVAEKEKNFLSAVVYVNDCETVIDKFLYGLITILNKNFEKYEIICINDASSDGSIATIRDIAQRYGDGIISIVNMSYYQGLEASMNAGMDLAIGDFVFEFDRNTPDYDMSIIMDVYRRSLQGYDIVVASGSKHRFSSMMFYSLFNKNANLQYELHTEAFRLLSRRAINRVHSMSKTIPYRKALYANCGLKVDTILYDGQNVSKVKTKKIQKNKFNTAFDSLVLFTDVAYKMAIILATLMMVATLAGAIYTVIIYFIGRPVTGFTTTMLVITAAFFGVFAILGIVIKYLSVIVALVFNEQKYIVESVVKVSKHESND